MRTCLVRCNAGFNLTSDTSRDFAITRRWALPISARERYSLAVRSALLSTFSRFPSVFDLILARYAPVGCLEDPVSNQEAIETHGLYIIQLVHNPISSKRYNNLRLIITAPSKIIRIFFLKSFPIPTRPCVALNRRRVIPCCRVYGTAGNSRRVYGARQHGRISLLSQSK